MISLIKILNEAVGKPKADTELSIIFLTPSSANNDLICAFISAFLLSDLACALASFGFVPCGLKGSKYFFTIDSKSFNFSSFNKFETDIKLLPKAFLYSS